MSIGSIPNAWRHAIVTPVHKSGSAANVSNYWPISLTCIACKIMERIVSKDVLHYLRANNIITKHQHGFLSRRSTSTLLETLNHWTLAIRDRRSVVVAYSNSNLFIAISKQHSRLKCGTILIDATGRQRNNKNTNMAPLNFQIKIITIIIRHNYIS